MTSGRASTSSTATETASVCPTTRKGWVAGFRTREELVEQCDVILQPKPLLSDLAEMRAARSSGGGRTASRMSRLTQLAIDQGLTLIAFEAMNHWNSDGSFNLHVFHKNNEACRLLLGAARHADRRIHR